MSTDTDVTTNEKVRQRKASYYAYCKRWQKANPEKVAEYQRRWREKHKEEHAAYQKKWREANKDKIRAAQKAWREKNRDKIRKYKRKWVAQNSNEQKAYARQVAAAYRLYQREVMDQYEELTASGALPRVPHDPKRTN